MKRNKIIYDGSIIEVYAGTAPPQKKNMGKRLKEGKEGENQG